MKFDHAYTIAFSIVSQHDAENVTTQELLDGLYQRFRDLDKNGDEIQEAVGAPFDSYEVPEEWEYFDGTRVRCKRCKRLAPRHSETCKYGKGGAL